MVVVDLHWMGLLCNVDSSILTLRLPHDFQVKFLSEEEAFELLLKLDKVSTKMEFAQHFVMNMSLINTEEKRLYYIYRSERMDIDTRKQGRMVTIAFPETGQLYDSVIRKIIRLLRLVTDGDIRVPYDFTYYNENGKITSYITRYSNWHVSTEKYHLKKEDMEFVSNLTEIDFPFKRKYIQLAFENYEDSYEAQHPTLSFLSIMIAMEVLFNPGRSELRYRISRNCAVLLGKDEKESQEIFSTIKNIYDVRSKIIHSGDSSNFDKENLPLLRHYLRESIKKIIFCDESKDTILGKLNTLGFGEFRKYGSVKLKN